MEELVTVIMPFLNEEKYLKRAIQSILDQTYSNLEILLIDDYSTDNSVEVCKSFNDNRISIHSKDPDPQGLSFSRNLGISIAKGQYITFQDADDISLPSRIEKQVELIKSLGKNTITGTWVEKIIESDAEKEVVNKMILPEKHEDIIKAFQRQYRRSNSIVAGIICARKEVFKNFMYNVQLKYQQDWDFLLRVFESGNYRFANVPEYLYKYYIQSSGTTYQKDWIDWNLVIRKNQALRKENKPEFKNPDEMYEETRKNPYDFIKLLTLRKLILLKRSLNFDTRKLSSAK